RSGPQPSTTQATVFRTACSGFQLHFPYAELSAARQGLQTFRVPAATGSGAPQERDAGGSTRFGPPKPCAGGGCGIPPATDRASARSVQARAGLLPELSRLACRSVVTRLSGPRLPRVG